MGFVLFSIRTGIPWSTNKKKEINVSYEIEKLVENLKQKLFLDYKSMPVFTD